METEKMAEVSTIEKLLTRNLFEVFGQRDLARRQLRSRSSMPKAASSQILMDVISAMKRLTVRSLPYMSACLTMYSRT
jgi:hypothetical protein